MLFDRIGHLCCKGGSAYIYTICTKIRFLFSSITRCPMSHHYNQMFRFQRFLYDYYQKWESCFLGYRGSDKAALKSSYYAKFYVRKLLAMPVGAAGQSKQGSPCELLWTSVHQPVRSRFKRIKIVQQTSSQSVQSLLRDWVTKRLQTSKLFNLNIIRRIGLFAKFFVFTIHGGNANLK